jgi:hypothetical protein
MRNLTTETLLAVMAALSAAFLTTADTVASAEGKSNASPVGEFIVADGLAITPFALEQLSNPCSIDVDDRGRVWVGEAANYRKKTRKGGDRILILEDTNKICRADLTRVFYQNPDIDGVHGVCVLGNKVIVSAPDRILILTETHCFGWARPLGLHSRR